MMTKLSMMIMLMMLVMTILLIKLIINSGDDDVRENADDDVAVVHDPWQ
jgi:hypothetical protein